MTICTQSGAAQTIAGLLAEIAQEKTIILLSGGSSAAIGVNALKFLGADLQHNITVLLADERYVDYDSEDSNANLLKKYGLSQNCGQFIEVLSADGLSRQDTAQQFWQNLAAVMKDNKHIVAVLGVGPDNHTAGILPNTDAAKSISDGVIEYATDMFERITIAPNFFKNIDYAFVYAEGTDKEAAIQAIEQDFDVVSHPSQLVKKAKNWQLLFNKEKI
jgi:6-phosphogluconolactonase/glucosamine-6-phosphate isomerase/deaminase